MRVREEILQKEIPPLVNEIIGFLGVRSIALQSQYELNSEEMANLNVSVIGNVCARLSMIFSDIDRFSLEKKIKIRDAFLKHITNHMLGAASILEKHYEKNC